MYRLKVPSLLILLALLSGCAIAPTESGDYPPALEIVQPLAEQGFVDAQYNLGLMYEKGEGVPQNYSQAANWYRKAAEQDDAGAQTKLGFLYATGQGVPQDYIEAHMWSNLAASQGNKMAVNNRDVIAERMTSQQISEAQALAREWVSKNRQ